MIECLIYLVLSRMLDVRTNPLKAEHLSYRTTQGYECNYLQALSNNSLQITYHSVKQIQHYVDRNMYVISYSTNIVIAQESLVEWNDNKLCKDEKKMLQHILKCSWQNLPRKLSQRQIFFVLVLTTAKELFFLGIKLFFFKIGS